MSTLIRFRVPDEWIPEIEKACRAAGIDPEIRKGVASGYPLWVKTLVAAAIGAEVEDYHEARSEYWASKG